MLINTFRVLQETEKNCINYKLYHYIILFLQLNVENRLKK